MHGNNVCIHVSIYLAREPEEEALADAAEGRAGVALLHHAWMDGWMDEWIMWECGQSTAQITNPSTIPPTQRTWRVRRWSATSAAAAVLSPRLL